MQFFPFSVKKRDILGEVMFQVLIHNLKTGKILFCDREEPSSTSLLTFITKTSAGRVKENPYLIQCQLCMKIEYHYNKYHQ